MSHFRLHIQTDNAAFGDTRDEVAAQVAKMLRQVATEIEQQGFPDTCDLERIRDYNGNKVGHYRRYEA